MVGGYFGPLAKVFHSLKLWAGCETVEKDRIGGGILWIETATEPGFGLSAMAKWLGDHCRAQDNELPHLSLRLSLIL